MTNQYGGIASYVSSARTLQERLNKHLQGCKKDEDCEELLIKVFCIDSLPVSVQTVAARAMLSDYDLWGLIYPFCYAPAGSKEVAAVMSVVMVVAHFVVQLTQIGVWDRNIVTSNATLWSCVSLTVLVQYYLVQECAVVFLKNVLIEQVLVASKVIERLELLARKSKLILMRRLGLMRDANALVQHFNPACRAARSFPHLPVARLLLSVGDHDFYGLTLPVQKSFLDRLYTSLVESPLLLFAYVPYCIGELLTELFIMMLVGAAIFGLYFFGVFYPIAGIVVASALVGVPLSYELFVLYRSWRRHQAAVMDTESALHKYFYDINKDMKNWQAGDAEGKNDMDSNDSTVSELGVSVKPTAASKSIFSGLLSSSVLTHVESKRIAVGASVSIHIQQRVVGPPIRFNPSNNSSKSETARRVSTPRSMRQVRVSPALHADEEKTRETETNRRVSLSSESHTHHRKPSNAQGTNSGPLSTSRAGFFGAFAGPQRIAGRGIARFDHTAPNSPPESTPRQSPDDVQIDFLQVSAEVFDPQLHGELDALSADWNSSSVIVVPDVAVSSLLQIDTDIQSPNTGTRCVQSSAAVAPSHLLSEENDTDGEDSLTSDVWRHSNFALNAALMPFSSALSPETSRSRNQIVSAMAHGPRRASPLKTPVRDITKNSKSKPYTPLHQLRRIHALRHGSPSEVPNARERHRSECEARAPGTNALLDALTVTQMAASTQRSHYTRTMLVSADAELPTYDILANIPERNFSNELIWGVLSADYSSSNSALGFSDDPPEGSPMDSAPLHPTIPTFPPCSSADSPGMATVSGSDQANNLIISPSERARQKHKRSRCRHLT